MRHTDSHEYERNLMCLGAETKAKNPKQSKNESNINCLDSEFGGEGVRRTILYGQLLPFTSRYK